MRCAFKRVPRVSVGTLGWIVLLAFLGYRVSPQVAAAVGAGGDRETVPAFTLRTLDGETVTSEGLRGKVVLVNFWATWCPPCRVEMPGFQRVYEDKRDQGFVVLGLSTDRAGEGGVREFLRERGVTYPVAMASSEVVRDFGGVRALPTSFLVDREGRIRHEVTGIFAEPALRMAVNHLLQDRGPNGGTGGGQ